MRIALATLLVVLLPATAHSATRYAAPDGSGTACSASAPCALPTAVQQAVAHDTVFVGPGTYSGLRDPDATNLAGIHLVGGHPRPLLRFDRGGVTVGGGTPDEEGVPGSVRHLDVETASEIAITLYDGEIEGVVARTASADTAACAIGKGRVLESVCLADGGSGVRVFAGDAVIGAVTALGATAGVTIDRPESGVTSHVAVVATIARATSGNDIDTNTHDADFGGNVLATASYSNFGSGPAGDGNQSAPPVFLDGYHQAPSSPTIDAFPAPPDTESDVDGDARTAGAMRDIGADEYHAPTAATDGADVLSTQDVDLRGRVDPQGPAGQVRFEYGRDASYGRSVEIGEIAGSEMRDVQARLAGLDPGTTYHFRIVLTVGPTVVAGANRTFTTPAAAPAAGGPPPGPQPPPPTAVPPPSFTFAPGAGRFRTGLPIRFTCSSGCRLQAAISVSRATARRTGIGRRAMVLGRATLTTDRAGDGVLRVRVPSRLRRRWRRLRTLPVVLRVDSVAATGARFTATVPATLRR